MAKPYGQKAARPGSNSGDPRNSTGWKAGGSPKPPARSGARRALSASEDELMKQVSGKPDPVGDPRNKNVGPAKSPEAMGKNMGKSPSLKVVTSEGTVARMAAVARGAGGIVKAGAGMAARAAAVAALDVVPVVAAGAIGYGLGKNVYDSRANQIQDYIDKVANKTNEYRAVGPQKTPARKK